MTTERTRLMLPDYLEEFHRQKEVSAARTDLDPIDMERHERYTVMPLIRNSEEAAANSVEQLYVHNWFEWNASFLSYESFSEAWVTEDKHSKERIPVDLLEVHLMHDHSYGHHIETKRNSSYARAHFKITSVPLKRPHISGYACVEHVGFGRFCSPHARSR